MPKPVRKPTLTTDPLIAKALAALDQVFVDHEDHTWKQIGRCVYCHDCDMRLYQGRIPKDHTNVATARKQREPSTTTEMRARWNKD